MSGKKDKLIRKQIQHSNRETTKTVNLVLERLTAQPFKLRWRTALRILIGKSLKKEK